MTAPAPRIDIVHPTDLTDTDLALWNDLRTTAATASAANPFMSAEFSQAVGRVRSDTRVAVLRRRGKPVGYFPYQRGRWGCGRAVGLGVSDCQGAVLPPGLHLDPHHLMRACSLNAWEFNHLESGQDLFLPYATAQFASPVVDLTGGFTAYEDHLRAHARGFWKAARSQERRMTRNLGPLRFVFDDPDPAALRALIAWKSAHYRRTGRRDPFSQPWIARLVDLLSATAAPDCTGTLSVLYAADRPVAAHFGLRSRTVLSCWFPSYDLAVATYSPGRVLYLRMIEAAAGAGIDLVDFGRGEAAYKNSFKTGDLLVHEGALRTAGPGAALHWLRREPMRAAHRLVRDHPALKSAAVRTLRTVGTIRAR
ncbi:GNAT family N-acetyltransferase [Streptomyces antibioticus]|uniref:Cellulose biosynthesis protein CelD n=1 Tax=Streptomyces antibioticus TaxID=1890 RepID=A0AAE6YE51_STRAT|nr:GNAT family N-acetyltransferase [Streptomyces antibioticus]MCX5173042.1 GNAT family N-acetyltransferase [Streptomyces antibioticus]OOQ47765.1 cellulose biosynthesis protein CelD [Streptomyces antibioticus]QIT48085.1 GNAT family N-acetyltransferase [Streptomyces antibioticus]